MIQATNIQLRNFWQRWRMALLLLPSFLLSGCYIPYGYLTKIQIANDGRYEFNFSGRLLSPSFMNKLVNEELSVDSPEYEVEKNAHIAELQRQGFSNIQYSYPASYEAQLEQSGNLFKERLVSFPSRHGSVLVIKLLQDNRLEVNTRRLTSGYIEQLESTDISFVGNVVIWTDMLVDKNNATNIYPGKPNAYLWEFKNLNDPPIQLIGQIGVNLQSTGG